MITTILFDLDGTLVDTAPDLGLALNLQLKRHGKPALPDAKIRPFASHGSRGLIGLGFGITPDEANFIEMRDEYLAIYDTVFTRSPVLLSGIVDLLQAIENEGLIWGIVTNKPRRFTIGLIESMGLNLESRAACIVCGDDASLPKPSPATLLMACEKVGVKPENCIYVGDAERDVIAGKAAGMKTVVALFGYIDVTDKPAEWGADALIAQPEELIKLIPPISKVITIHDFYDRPRLGIVEKNGIAYIYEGIFDEVIDEYSNDYYLSPIDAKQLALVLEDWEIWCRWDSAFKLKQTSQDTHPALPNDLKRHTELVNIIGQLKSNPNNRQRYHAIFSSTDFGPSAKYTVCWTLKKS